MPLDQDQPDERDELHAQGAIEDDAAELTDGESPDVAPEPQRARPAPPIGRGTSHAPLKEVRERRVTQVFTLLVGGRQRWEIAADIKVTQAKEIADRAAARAAAVAAGSATPDADALARVPPVWGDQPIPLRTQDDYVRRAKVLLSAQSDEFAKQRRQQLALQVARINATYGAAMAAGKHYAALKATELLIELLDLKGHAKQAALEASLAGKPSEGESDEPRLLPTDPESRANAFAALVSQSVAADPTLREQLAALVPKPSVMP